MTLPYLTADEFDEKDAANKRVLALKRRWRQRDPGLTLSQKLEALNRAERNQRPYVRRLPHG